MKPDLLIIRALIRSKIKLLDGLKYKQNKNWEKSRFGGFEEYRFGGIFIWKIKHVYLHRKIKLNLY